MSLSSFRSFANQLPAGEKMPALFVGHGSPMNGIEDNEFSRRWTKMATEIPIPAAVIVISAHWFTRGTKTTAVDHPPTIHDFGGFPRELFEVQYPAPGDPALARETTELIRSTPVLPAHDWGLDHGTWTIVRHMYPKADIPVLQLSIDYTKDAKTHYEIGRELESLRSKGVLIIGSGNMVHNLRMMSWQMIHGGGFDWANEMNDKFKALITDNDHGALIDYEQLGPEAKLAIPTPEHYLPLIYTLALKGTKEGVSFFNDKAVGGSITMTSLKVA